MPSLHSPTHITHTYATLLTLQAPECMRGALCGSAVFLYSLLLILIIYKRHRTQGLDSGETARSHKGIGGAPFKPPFKLVINGKCCME